jgi:hypothetical protein
MDRELADKIRKRVKYPPIADIGNPSQEKVVVVVVGNILHSMPLCCLDVEEDGLGDMHCWSSS